METASTTISSFSGLWWSSTIPTILVIILAIRWLKKLEEEDLVKWERIIFALIIINEIFWQFYYYKSGAWSMEGNLPFHLCDISRLIGAFLLVRYNQYVFEFLILLGFGGALQAIMTPEIGGGHYDTFTHVGYYIAHGLIFFGGFYQLYVRKRKLEKSAWWRSFFIGIIVLGIVGVINKLINGNYIYLCHKPAADNPLLIGEWPYYLLCFLGFGFINIVLFHFLFRWWGRKID